MRIVAYTEKEKMLISQLKMLNFAILDFTWEDYKKFSRNPKFEAIKRKDKLIVLPKGKVKLTRRNKNTFEVEVLELIP